MWHCRRLWKGWHSEYVLWSKLKLVQPIVCNLFHLTGSGSSPCFRKSSYFFKISIGNVLKLTKWGIACFSCTLLSFQEVFWREDWFVLCLVGLVHRDAVSCSFGRPLCVPVRRFYSGALPRQVKSFLVFWKNVLTE